MPAPVTSPIIAIHRMRMTVLMTLIPAVSNAPSAAASPMTRTAPLTTTSNCRAGNKPTNLQHLGPRCASRVRHGGGLITPQIDGAISVGSFRVLNQAAGTAPGQRVGNVCSRLVCHITEILARDLWEGVTNGACEEKVMFDRKFQRAMCALALTGAVGCGSSPVHADDRDNDRDNGHRVKTVFVIAMENHNWTQPNTQTNPQQIFQNPAAPFINSLVNGTSGISDQVAFANGYINAGVGVHPSEPNYIWAEAGTSFGVNNDDDPYHTNCTPDTVQTTNQHLSAFLT